MGNFNVKTMIKCILKMDVLILICFSKKYPKINLAFIGISFNDQVHMYNKLQMN